MDGQQYPPVQAAPEAGYTQTSDGPVDLAAAFRQLRANQQEAAQPVDEGEKDQTTDVADTGKEIFGGSDNIAATTADTTATTTTVDAGVPAASEYDGGGADAGGSTAPVQAVDYSPQMQRIAQQLQREARNEVLKNFTDKNIKLMKIGDIYERRDDGTIIFNNPDDPRSPFRSRKEAQDYIDSFNVQVQTEYDNQIREAYARKLKDASPQFQLLQFAPYYDQMSQVQKDIFDDIIEPYAIERNGQTIGFNCDLIAAAKQAITIARRFEKQQPAQQQKTYAAAAQKQVETPATPAMDMKTGSADAAKDNDEPKSIEEAMRMINQRKKENR